MPAVWPWVLNGSPLFTGGAGSSESNIRQWIIENDLLEAIIAIGEGRFEQQVAGYFTANETFDVGCETCSPVSDLYESPFAFTGTINKVIVDISEATFDQLARQHEVHARWAIATQ